METTIYGHWTDTKIKIKSWRTCLFDLLKIDDDIENDGDEKMRIENKDYEVYLENNYLFLPYQAAILKRQGKLGDFPDLEKLVSDFRNKGCAIVRTRNKGCALLFISSRTVSAVLSS
jgi:hypothetical protein